jgi:hypothetical protein
VFASKGFLDLGGRETTNQILSGLTSAGGFSTRGSGLYHVPQMHTRLGIPLSPDDGEIAEALAQQFGRPHRRPGWWQPTALATSQSTNGTYHNASTYCGMSRLCWSFVLLLLWGCYAGSPRLLCGCYAERPHLLCRRYAVVMQNRPGVCHGRITNLAGQHHRSGLGVQAWGSEPWFRLLVQTTVVPRVAISGLWVWKGHK